MIDPVLEAFITSVRRVGVVGRIKPLTLRDYAALPEITGSFKAEGEVRVRERFEMPPAGCEGDYGQGLWKVQGKDKVTFSLGSPERTQPC